MKIQIQLTADDGKVYSGELQLGPTSGSAKPKKVTVEASSPSAGNKCPDVIERLWKNGFFKQAVDFEAVSNAIDEEGYSFPKDTIRMAITRAKYLTKHGSKGALTWKQKYPAP